MTVTADDLFRGMRLAVPNQGICITLDWAVVTVRYAGDGMVHYTHEFCPDFPWDSTPEDRFLAIVNAPTRGPHHTPRPCRVDN